MTSPSESNFLLQWHRDVLDLLATSGNPQLVAVDVFKQKTYMEHLGGILDKRPLVCW